MNDAPAQPAASPCRQLAVIALGPAVVMTAFTAPLTTLTSTAEALSAGPGAQAWILSAMSVGTASGLLISGALGDDHGRRRVFTIGLTVLAAASLFGAAAPSALMLILARVGQGLGAAAVLACGLGLIGQLFPADRDRARATGVWAAAISGGVAAGPIIAAELQRVGGWRAPYVVTAMAGLAMAVVARATLPESRAAHPRRVDAPGATLLGLGLAVLLGGLTEGRSGWGQPIVLELIAAGLALLAGFVVVERRAMEPMLDLALFRRADFIGATVSALMAGAGVLSLLSLAPTLMERAMGVGPVLAAVVLTAWSATGGVMAFSVRWLPARFTPRGQLIAGLSIAAAGQLALLGPHAEGSVLGLLPGLLIAGAAYGLLNAAVGRQAVASVPSDRVAMGGGANNTARFLGSSIGLTIVTVAMTHAGASGGAGGIIAGWNVAVGITAGFSLLGAATVAVTRSQA